MHWTTFGICFTDCADARCWAGGELERTDPVGAHPVLVDAAVVRCPIDWTHDVRPACSAAPAQVFAAALGNALVRLAS